MASANQTPGGYKFAPLVACYFAMLPNKKSSGVRLAPINRREFNGSAFISPFRVKSKGCTFRRREKSARSYRSYGVAIYCIISTRLRVSLVQLIALGIGSSRLPPSEVTYCVGDSVQHTIGGGWGVSPTPLFYWQIRSTWCVCVCVFFPFILDFNGRTSRGHTGRR